ncbi:MAG: hypothetical protein VX610_00275 [SAR324 cluster bacterium]|nr:hypothetical protein [SAR324 cluster bacterium]
MIVKAIPKDGGLFIPGFSAPDSGTSEVLVEVQVIPKPRNHAGATLTAELGPFLSQQPKLSPSSVAPMRNEETY